jgi:hypothetical protein
MSEELKNIRKEREYQSPGCWFWAGWEPMRHYRRMGKSGSPFFGKGAWLPEWERRKFSHEMIDEAVKLGATVLITEFFKGFGRQIEQETWPQLTEFVHYAHERGVKVWGYAQACSLYYETMGAEIEDWESWVARDREGRMQLFSNAYYRAAPCLNSSDYADYLASVITDGVRAIGFDGVHLDNAYYKHCWCARCADLFRKYLGNSVDLNEVAGIPLSKHVQPPPFPQKGGVGLDPLQILWLKFGLDVRSGFFRRLKTYLTNHHPDLVVAGNPAFPRGDAAMLLQCVDPSREAEAFDFLCCENGNQPRIEDGWIASQAEAHLLAEAGNYRIWVTSWKSSATGVLPPRPPGGIWACMAEEYSFGSILGNNWALRPSGDGGSFFCEQEPAMAEAFREARTFFSDLDALVASGSRRTWAEVAVLHDPFSASLFGNGEIRLNLALHQYLLRRGIPFHIVLPGKPLPESARVLVAFHVGALSAERLAEMKEFAQRPGCQVWMAGHTAQTDEWFIPRNTSDLESLRRSPGFAFTRGLGDTWQEAFTHPLVLQSNPESYFGKRDISLRAADDVAFDQFFKTEAYHPVIHFQRPENVLVHSQITSDGRLLIHLRDQSGGCEWVSGAQVVFESGFPAIQEVSIVVPASVGEFLSVNNHGDQRVVNLQPFQHYALVTLKIKSVPCTLPQAKLVRG